MSNTLAHRNQVLEYAKRYRPYVFLHPEEDYYPCTIQYYLKHSSLWDGDKMILGEGRLTTSNIPVNGDEKDWALSIDEDYRRGENPDNVPFYVNVRRLDDGDWQIIYIFMYAYNGPFWLCGIPEKCKCCAVGQHQADIEHISVIVNSYGRVKKLYYAAHGTHDGKWLDPDQVEWTRTKRPIVYSAKHSHASYWTENMGCCKGIVPRCCWFISDHVGKGTVWDPEVVFIDDETHWNLFPGDMGSPDHVPTPMHHGWWPVENGRSTNWFMRMFCACV